MSLSFLLKFSICDIYMFCAILISGPATPGGPRGSWPTTFLRSKKKKGRPREKRKGFNAETIKRLSPRSKYYCFNHSRTSRIRKFFLSANHRGRQYFSVLHGPPHFEIHFAGPVYIILHKIYLYFK